MFDASERRPEKPVRIAIRIPGVWRGPADLIAAMPAGWRLGSDSLAGPDGSKFDFDARAADDQFPGIFLSSCRRPPAEEEAGSARRCTAILLLSGPGGSLSAAHAMMKAASALIMAGGAGVFIDNAALAHGGSEWLAMTEDGGADALTFAFVTIIAAETEVRTIGMHALGLRDVVMKRFDVDEGGFDIVEAIRYLAISEKPVGDGHLLADEAGPRFRVVALPDVADYPDSPMFNPFGRFKLVNLRDAAEAN